MESCHTIVVGLGNEYRGDDAAGLAVAERLRALAIPGVRVVAGVPDGASLIAYWESARRCYVIDCTVSGAASGTIRRFTIGPEAIPERMFSSLSTHAFSVSQAIELARQLGRLPKALTVYGIEGKQFKAGGPLSDFVVKSVEVVAAQIAADLSTPA